MPISPDDPRLTAFALGELETSERAEVEALLTDDSESRAIVADIQSVAKLLADQLLAAPRPRLDPSRRLAIEACLGAKLGPNPRAKFRIIRWAGLAMAASLLVGVGTFALWREASNQAPRPTMIAMQSPQAVVPPAPMAPPPAESPASGPEPASKLAKSETAPEPASDVMPAARASRGMVGLSRSNSVRHEPARRFTSKAKVLPSESDASKPDPASMATVDNPFLLVSPEDPLSLPVRCDSESYVEVRRYLNQGTAPPKDAVRIEELINYFPYAYSQPVGTDAFSVNVEVARCPWEPAHRLVRVGLKGRDVGPVARDVSIEVKFNPDRASAYRQIGYENRILPGQNTAEAGDSGARHSVTALYEIIPAKPSPVELQSRERVQMGRELVEVDLSCKAPEGAGLQSLKCPADDKDGDIAAASRDFQFATAVAGFGMLLRDSPYKGSLTWPSLEELATIAVGPEPTGDRKEFLDLVRKGRAAKGQAR